MPIPGFSAVFSIRPCRCAATASISACCSTTVWCCAKRRRCAPTGTFSPSGRGGLPRKRPACSAKGSPWWRRTSRRPPLPPPAPPGLPSVGISNFSWDWIYEGLAGGHPGYDDVLASMRDDYAAPTCCCACPFTATSPPSGGSRMCRWWRGGRLQPPAEVRRQLEIPEGCRLGLLSFGGFGLREFAFAALERLRGWIFLIEAGTCGRGREPAAASRPKPTIPTWCGRPTSSSPSPATASSPKRIANGCAVLYTGRGDFREQAVLVAALHRYGRAREIGNDVCGRAIWARTWRRCWRSRPAKACRRTATRWWPTGWLPDLKWTALLGRPGSDAEQMA